MSIYRKFSNQTKGLLLNVCVCVGLLPLFLELAIMEIQPKTLQMRFETGSHFFALAGLELTEIHLPRLLSCWD